MWKNKADKRKKRSSLYRHAPALKAGGRDVRSARILDSTGLKFKKGSTIIAVPITGSSRDEILSQADGIRDSSARLVEWRADYFEHSSDPEAMKELAFELGGAIGDRPLLFTYRTSLEGGEGSSDMGAYGQLLMKMADCGSLTFFDVEGMHADFDPEGLIGALRDRGKAVIASAHFFDRTPKKKEMEAILQKLAGEGADLVKLAVMPSDASDVLKLMQVTEKMNRRLPCPLITMAMGEVGRISRISGSLTGSAVTFASLQEGSAPGQIPLDQLVSVLNILEKR